MIAIFALLTLTALSKGSAHLQLTILGFCLIFRLYSGEYVTAHTKDAWRHSTCATLTK